MEHFSPDQVYYLAAHHHSSQDGGIGASDIWQRSWDAHVGGLTNVLASAAEHCNAARVFYASSSRIFGAAASSPQNEDTPWNPDCPYGVTKASGMLVADYFRRTQGVFASCGILYNHESPFRNPEFVTQRVVNGLIAIARGEASKLELGCLDARVDWGYAPDYTRAMQVILDAESPGDYVIATGETHTVRELVEIAAGVIGVQWKECVVESADLLRRSPQELRGDPTRLRRATGWRPETGFRAMVRILAEAAAEPADRAVNTPL